MSVTPRTPQVARSSACATQERAYSRRQYTERCLSVTSSPSVCSGRKFKSTRVRQNLENKTHRTRSPMQLTRRQRPKYTQTQRKIRVTRSSSVLLLATTNRYQQFDFSKVIQTTVTIDGYTHRRLQPTVTAGSYNRRLQSTVTIDGYNRRLRTIPSRGAAG